MNSSCFSSSFIPTGLALPLRKSPTFASFPTLAAAKANFQNGVRGVNDAKLGIDKGSAGVVRIKSKDRSSSCKASRKSSYRFQVLKSCGNELPLDKGRYSTVIEAKKGNPPVMPAVMTPGGPLDLSSVLFRNRIIFIGQPVNSQVAQRVISQLVTLATIDENADILMYLNCPGGSTYSVLAIYDCMSWIKPKVGIVCFGVAASQGALLLAGGEKGMRYAMPNARIMIHQPQSGCGGHVEDVRRQVNEAVQTRHKVDQMYAAFTGQTVEKVQEYTERDRFLSSSEALEFGLIDGVLETEY